MFVAMDKNKDGFISKDEAKGTPHEAAFATLDKNHDGKLSREEHYNAPEHVAARAKKDKSASAGSSTDKTASTSSSSTDKTASADTSSGIKKQ
jgi:Ca2+-binding EF-hand superfamily protein